MPGTNFSPPRRREYFRRLATWVAIYTAKAGTFALALVLIAVWLMLGPVFGFSDSWQLVVNRGTTIITFLMVFLIQNTQNRDTRAIHLKLDELIRATKHARNQLIDLEQLSDAELDNIHEELSHWNRMTEARIEQVERARKRKR